MRWAEQLLDSATVEGRHVIEAGALDVNGSLRPWVESSRPASYIGTDIRPGPGVDLVTDAAELHPQTADLLISTEMLEHAEHWQRALAGMLRAVRPGGQLLLTTRGPGFWRHDHPGDYWRFTCPLLARVLVTAGDMDLQLLQPDPDWPGVFVLASKPMVWRPEPISGYAAFPVEDPP